MVDREISIGNLVACTLWGACLGLWFVACLMHNEDIGRLSVIVCGGAVTATVRMFLVAQWQRIRTALIVTDGHPPVRAMR